MQHGGCGLYKFSKKPGGKSAAAQKGKKLGKGNADLPGALRRIKGKKGQGE